METKEPILKSVFGDSRILGLAGNKSSGKTNNLFFLVKDLRAKKPELPVYAYGLPKELKPLMAEWDIKQISSIRQLINKKDCVLIIDEMQRLKLNDRRYKDQLAEFINFVYHRNVYVILSSPDIRQFNSVIGGFIERWLLKSVFIDQCINGSQLKGVVESYQGKYKLLGQIDVPMNELLIINDDEELIISCDYVPEADTKKEQRQLL